MKKNIFYWAFLVLAGMSLTACSSGDDNIADNTTPVTPGSQNKTVILTGTIGVGGDETRAVDNNGEISWKANDPITINYETTSGSGYSRATGKITQVSSDNHYATFEAALTNPKDDGFIGFAYGTVNSADPTNAYDFTFNYSAYYNDQDGTTEGISNSRLDYACTEEKGEVKMAVDGSTATLKGNALLKNQFCMYMMEISGGLKASLLEIFIANESDFDNPRKIYRIKPQDTPSNKGQTNVFYVALEPKEVGDKVKVVATISEDAGAMKLDSEYKLNMINTLSPSDYGKFICVDESDENQAYLCNYDNRTTATICEHTYGTATKFVKGKLYTMALTTSSKTLVPKAVIAHVGAIPNYCSNFLALALKDVYSGTKTLSGAQAEIGGGWINDNVKLKIAGTVYNSLVGSTAEGEKGKIDAVRDNPKNATTEVIEGVETSTPGVYEIVSSASLTSPAAKGWRIPTVTDFRYIFQSLGVMDATKINATTPAGIVDHDGWYYSGQNKDTYEYKKYGTGNVALVSSINSKLFHSATADVNITQMAGQFYWLSSQVINTAGATQSSKAWRFSFSADQFIWTEGTDESLARLVFAY